MQSGMNLSSASPCNRWAVGQWAGLTSSHLSCQPPSAEAELRWTCEAWRTCWYRGVGEKGGGGTDGGERGMAFFIL